ncbi:MAG TPA: PAS domain-containing protein [Rhodobacterales bacterium]|nr:PAS domain-containing protein [Rhodobacterales bacterium]
MTHEYIHGDKVISIQPIRSRALYPAIGQVETYWEGLRNGRLMPARSEVDPRGIAPALEFAFILEKIAPGLARIRLAGMHLNDLLAMEVRGMPITAMFLPEARREMQGVLEAVLDTPAAVRLTLTGDRGFGRSPLDGQMLLLPMRDETGAPSRILGALQTRGKIGRGPRRFAIHDIETKPLLGDPLTALRPVPTPAPRMAPTPLDPTETPGAARKARDLARRLASFNRTNREAERGHPHLRLVYDADMPG